MKFYAALAKAIKAFGPDTMFGVMGDANMYMVHAYVHDEAARYVSAANESGAVLMAHGYGAVSGNLGVATVTHGAVTNTVTALCEATAARRPLLLIAWDTPVVEKFHLQNVPQRDLVLSTGAGFEPVRSPHTVVEDVAVAVRRAEVERRPIVLNVPAEFQWVDVDYEARAATTAPRREVSPSDAALDVAVGIIASSVRPLILAGRGAATGEGRAALLRLAARIGAPVATTLKGKDLFRGEAGNLGYFGNLSTPAALKAIGQSDCVIAFGAGLNRLTTDGGGLVKGKRLVHCDTDPASIGAVTAVDAALVGDVALTADTIVRWLDEAEIPPATFAASLVAGENPGASGPPPRRQTVPGTVDLKEALTVIEDAVPKTRTLTVDGGRYWWCAIETLSVPGPTDYVHTLDISSIGLGVAMSIGASVGAPRRPALTVVGDGSFMLGGLAEFNSAVRLQADLIVVLLNDGAYGAEYDQFQKREIDPQLSTFDWPDFAPVADALGGRGYTVRDASDLGGVRGFVANRTGPILIDVKLDPDNIPRLSA